MSDHPAPVLALQFREQSLHEPDVRAVEGTSTVATALAVMLERRFSQLPVLSEDGNVVGVVTVWSILKGLARESNNRQLLEGWVEDHMEPAEYVHGSGTLDSLLERCNTDHALLIGGPAALMGIITGDDLLRHFVDRSTPYVILRDIEEAVRALIRCCIPEPALPVALAAALSSKKTGVPARLEDCSFEDYRSIMLCRQNRSFFTGVLGPTTGIVGDRLWTVRDLRNRVMHFKDPVTPDELALLQEFRAWFAPKLQRAQRTAAAQGAA